MIRALVYLLRVSAREDNELRQYTGIMLAFLLLLAGPFLLVWATNILFAILIPYTLETWLAAFAIIVLLGRS